MHAVFLNQQLTANEQHDNEMFEQIKSNDGCDAIDRVTPRDAIVSNGVTNQTADHTTNKHKCAQIERTMSKEEIKPLEYIKLDIENVNFDGIGTFDTKV